MSRPPYKPRPPVLQKRHLAFYLSCAYLRFIASGRALDAPLMLLVQTQSHCNGRCSICPYPVVSKRLEQGRMEPALFEKIAGEVAAEPLLSWVTFELHNEPLLDRQLFERIGQLKSLCPDRYVTTVTNGMLLDGFSPQQMLASGLDRMVISLNAHTRQTYESINQGLDYERVMRNVSAVLSDPQLRRKVSLGFVFTRQNVDEVKQALEHWHRQGVTTRSVRVFSRAGTLEGYEGMKAERPYACTPSYLQPWKLATHRIHNATGCWLPFYQMCVLFNGDVILCCHDWNRATVLGNARESSLRQIWNSPRANEVRRLVLRKRYAEVESCNGCDLAV